MLSVLPTNIRYIVYVLGCLLIFVALHQLSVFSSSFPQDDSAVAQSSDFFVCGENKNWRDVPQGFDREVPSCQDNNPDTFGGCQGGEASNGAPCEYVPDMKPETVPETPDINPDSKWFRCTQEQADITGAPPIACSVADIQGHTFLRYSGFDVNNRLYCRRSLCISDAKQEAIEYQCSKNEIKEDNEEKCKLEDGVSDGINFTKFSFTGSNQQDYCYRTICASVDDPLTRRGTPTDTNRDLSSNICSSEECAANNIAAYTLPEEVSAGPVTNGTDQNPFQQVVNQVGGAVAKVLDSVTDTKNAMAPKELSCPTEFLVWFKCVFSGRGGAYKVDNAPLTKLPEGKPVQIRGVGIPGTQEPNQNEQVTELNWYPENIHPITRE